MESKAFGLHFRTTNLSLSFIDFKGTVKV